MKLLCKCLMLLFFVLNTNAQSKEMKINYTDSIIKIDSIISKKKIALKFIDEAKKFALAPELRQRRQIHLEMDQKLKKLNKKLKRGRISKSIYDKERLNIEKVLFKVDSIIGIRSKGFDKMLLDRKNEMDSLSERKKYLKSKI